MLPRGFNDLFDMNLLVVENDQTKTINEHSQVLQV